MPTISSANTKINIGCLQDSKCVNLFGLIQSLNPHKHSTNQTHVMIKDFFIEKSFDNLFTNQNTQMDNSNITESKVNQTPAINESLQNLFTIMTSFGLTGFLDGFRFVNVICDCLASQYKCYLDNRMQEYSVISDVVKNVYLFLYILLIIAGLAINLITFLILIFDYRHSKFFKLIKNFFVKKSALNSDFANKCKNDKPYQKSKYSNHTTALNFSNDTLILLLLFSYSIIIFYVVPFQSYLFYVNKDPIGLNCKISEFFKAFSVSLSIYSLVAMSLQRLFAIKFTQFLSNRINNRIFDLLNFMSILAFVKSLGSVAYSFLFSRYYRHYLITAILFLFTWIISISMGVYNMSQFRDEKLIDYDYFEQNMNCAFPSDLVTSSITCTNSDAADPSNDISRSDIIFVVILLMIPNLIVFSSYTWVCYHIWSHSSQLISPLKAHLSIPKTSAAENTEISSPAKIKKRKFRMKCKSRQEENSTSKYDENTSSVSSKSQMNPCEIKMSTSIIQESNNTITNTKNINNTYNHQNVVIQETNLDSSVNSSTRRKEVQIIADPTAIHPVVLHNHQFAIKRRNKAVTLTTCLMVVCFTICWTPFFTFPMLHSKITNTNTYNNLKVIIHLIGYSSAVCNPAILIIKSKRFRVRLKKFKIKLANYFQNDLSKSKSTKPYSTNVATVTNTVILNSVKSSSSNSSNNNNNNNNTHNNHILIKSLQEKKNSSIISFSPRN